MARTAETIALADGRVTLTVFPLPYKQAEDLLPEVTLVVAKVFEKLAELGMTITMKMDVLKLTPVLKTLAECLGDGKLKAMVPRLLATSVAEFTGENGNPQRAELIKESGRSELFDAHPEVYFHVLWHAGKVTYARFFPGRDLLARSPKTAAVA